jgi:glycosyltransferase involved in cell wall biosynthesis
MDLVDVVLPCLDEAGALPGVLGAMPDGYRAIVVDNGSTDGSAEIAGELGAIVVREPRRGYGAAVHTGVERATAEIVCVLDADGSLDPGELPRLVELITDGRARLAVGRRVPVGRGAWPWHARAGNLMLAGILRRRGVAVRDIGPVRAARRVDLLGLGIEDRAFGYPLELLIRAGAAGRSKVSGSVRGTLRAARDMAGVLA